MLYAEYKRLREIQAGEAAKLAARTQATRQRLAHIVVEYLDRALAAARITVSHKKAPQLQWSKRAWKEILQSKGPQEIADFLMNPPASQQALADSHPFGGLLVATHGH